LVGVDATRGIALLGMMGVHALYNANPDGSPTLVYTIAGGRSAAVFAVLAGVGIAFMTGRKQVRGNHRRGAAGTLLARALVIGVFGLALGYTDASIASVILPYYAVMFLLAIPLVFLPTRVLIAVSVAIGAGVPALSQLVRPDLPAPLLDNPSFPDVFGHPISTILELSVTGYYPAVPWMAYLGAGIVIGRLRLSSVRTALGLVGVGAAAAAVAATLSWWLLGPLGGLAHIQASTAPAQLETAPTVADYVTVSPEGTTPTTTWWWLAPDAPHSSTPLDLFQTTGSAVALLGLMLLLGHVGWPAIARAVRLLQEPLAAAGGMTLTLYTAHVIYMNSGLDDFAAVPGYILQVIVALLFALAWRKAIGRGPLETFTSWVAHRARAWTMRRTAMER
jgi:uncharacterized membrane protein YeiB